METNLKTRNSPVRKWDAVELLNGFSRVHDERIRKKIIEIVNTLADRGATKNKKK